MTIQQKYDLPLSFRQEVVKPILHCIRAGESCSIVGIGSVGKSNLLRFLRREDVRQAQLGDEWATYLFIYLDANKMLKQSLWGLLELMLHQLIIELINYRVDETVRQTIDDLHYRTTQSKTQYLALRYLDRVIDIVCKQLELRLVFLFDEFDELCRKMPARGFVALRALRDDNKYQLMYVVTTRLELKRLRGETSDIEAFEELVSPHTIWIGPYTEDDARLALRGLEARHRTTLDNKVIKEILLASGQHPGLLREIYHWVRQHHNSFSKAVATNSQVLDECQRIWLSLTPEEQEVMLSLATGMANQSLPTPVLQRLHHKGLVDTLQRGNQQIFSPIFAEFIQQQNPSADTGIYLDHDRHTIWVNGHEVQGLTPLEYRLMAYLVKKRGQICSRDELAQYLYSEDMTLEGQGVSDTRLDSILKRLRKRIEPNPQKPRYIITLRGHGFRLLD